VREEFGAFLFESFGSTLFGLFGVDHSATETTGVRAPQIGGQFCYTLALFCFSILTNMFNDDLGSSDSLRARNLRQVGWMVGWKSRA
jgi:hypothetical protein